MPSEHPDTGFGFPVVWLDDLRPTAQQGGPLGSPTAPSPGSKAPTTRRRLGFAHRAGRGFSPVSGPITGRISFEWQPTRLRWLVQKIMWSRRTWRELFLTHVLYHFRSTLDWIIMSDHTDKSDNSKKWKRSGKKDLSTQEKADAMRHQLLGDAAVTKTKVLELHTGTHFPIWYVSRYTITDTICIVIRIASIVFSQNHSLMLNRCNPQLSYLYVPIGDTYGEIKVRY